MGYEYRDIGEVSIPRAMKDPSTIPAGMQLKKSALPTKSALITPKVNELASEDNAINRYNTAKEEAKIKYIKEHIDQSRLNAAKHSASNPNYETRIDLPEIAKNLDLSTSLLKGNMVKAIIDEIKKYGLWKGD